jgi:hypothetical protein
VSAGREVCAEVLELPLDPADADAEDESAVAEVVDGGSLFGDEDRLALGQNENRGAQRNALCLGGDVAECRECLEELAEGLRLGSWDQDVVGRPDRVISESLGALGDRVDRRL